MLTADLAISWRRGNRTGPRYIEADDPAYLQIARDLIRIAREHQNQSRAALDRALDEYVGVGTDYKILRGLIKLIADRCVFETASAVEPSEARRALFLKARASHPVSASETAREQVITETAHELGCAPEELTEALFGDLAENQKLVAFDEPSAEQLLDHYNLAQAQALLYRSVEMRLRLEPQEAAGYRQLFDAVKTYRLIHTIKGSAAAGYEVRLNGPVSMFHRSQKYGIQMAVFLPALLACSRWRMRAEIALKPAGTAYFELSSEEKRLRTPYSSDEAGANPLVEKLIAGWSKLECEWAIEQSREVISRGDSALIPDLVFTDPQGSKVYLEMIGFWTPRYLSERLKEMERAGVKNFLFAASEEMLCSREAPSKLAENVILYKTSLAPDAVRRALSEHNRSKD